jgi:small redox-active disulfide protein 2
MKNIKVLGTGCAKCDMLYDSVKKIADGLEIEYELEKISDIMKITEFGVMMTPALVVDGQVKVSGKVPKDDEIKEMIS